MTVRKQKSQIGVKLGGVFLRPTMGRGDVLGDLRKSADYFEYQAPILSLPQFACAHDLEPQKLRPHGVRLSLSSEKRPPRSILKFLRAECEATKTPYLAEHIGLLNHNPDGPSFGYLIAPALNQTTIRTVARNVKILQDVCEVPVALENPVFYAHTTECTMSWIDFVLSLSDKLPQGTGWLIDYAHLSVSATNVGKKRLHNPLLAYAQTGRPIFEMHLAATKLDSFGVAHDDHSIIPSITEVKRFASECDYAGLVAGNITIEHNFSKATDQALIKNGLEVVRSIFHAGPAKHPSEPPRAAINVIATPNLRRQRERAGRLKLLANTIRDQLSDLSSADLEEVALNYGYESFLCLVHDFWLDPFAEHFQISLPYFSERDWDGIDLTIPLFEFLRTHRHASEISKASLRKLLVQIAIRQAGILASRDNRRAVFVSLARRCPPLDAGTYKIYVDKKDNIAAKKVRAPKYVLSAVPKPIVLSETKGVTICQASPKNLLRLSDPSKSLLRRAQKPRLSALAKHHIEQVTLQRARRGAG